MVATLSLTIAIVAIVLLLVSTEAPLDFESKWIRAGTGWLMGNILTLCVNGLIPGLVRDDVCKAENSTDNGGFSPVLNPISRVIKKSETVDARGAKNGYHKILFFKKLLYFQPIFRCQ